MSAAAVLYLIGFVIVARKIASSILAHHARVEVVRRAQALAEGRRFHPSAAPHVTARTAALILALVWPLPALGYAVMWRLPVSAAERAAAVSIERILAEADAADLAADIAAREADLAAHPAP